MNVSSNPIECDNCVLVCNISRRMNRHILLRFCENYFLFYQSTFVSKVSVYHGIAVYGIKKL